MPNIECKNCGQHFNGHFCPHCSQPAHTERIGLHYFLHDIPHSVFHVDKGLLFTIAALFRNPGKMLREYMAGKRVQHFKPFGYVVIMSTICTLIIKGIDALIEKTILSRNPAVQLTGPHGFFQHYFSVFIFLMIPILSLITWLIFRKKAYNYWEHFLANTYVAAQLNILLVLIETFRLLKVLVSNDYSSVNFTLFMVLFMFYYAYTFRVLIQDFKSSIGAFFILFGMNCLLVIVYLTGLSLVGIMSPWWHF
jgi:hypothetical protein